MSLKRQLSNYGAAIWSLSFGILHILWAFGYFILLPDEQAEQAFNRSSFYIYNLVVIGICFVGAVIALMQSHIIRTPISDSAIRLMGYTIVVLLSIRGLAGLFHVCYLVLQKEILLSTMILWDVWFCIGGFVYFLNTKSGRRPSILFTLCVVALV